MNDTLQPLFADAGAVYDAGNAAEPLHFGDARAEYDALTGAIGLIDFSRRAQIELARR